MSQNIADESQTKAEQPTSADLLGKMTEATDALIVTQEKLVKATADVAKHTTDPNAHGAATHANILKAMPKPVLENGMFSFKDAEGKDIIAPVNLKGDTGAKGDVGEKGDMPDHRWNGTSLQIQKPDGSWGEEQDLQGPKGENGSDGFDGAPGQPPEHQWNGTSLKFKNPDGTWGEEQDLKGEAGAKGDDGEKGDMPDHRWNGTSLQIQKPDGSWGEEQDLQGPKGDPGDAAIATAEQPGIVQPDGVTTTVGEDGLLSAMGGNLLLNDETWLTESGTFTAPVTAWYEALLFAGGEGGEVIYVNTAYVYLSGGRSGAIKSGLVYLEKGQEVSFTIGAAGPGRTNTTASNSGGVTTFGELTTLGAPRLFGQTLVTSGPSKVNMTVGGGGLGAGHGAGGIAVNYLGGGGGAQWVGSTSAKTAMSGAQGSVRLRWHDPAKAAGPLTEPALFAARRMTASRAAAAPATVNLYDPETGQGSVWRAEDAEAKLAEGLISEEAWLEICAAKAAEEYAEWLTSPDTLAERFALLRAARDAKLSDTDYLMAPDYHLTDEQRTAVIAYRQALRDLPAQDGAPWDGGGELTPWPEMPAVSKVQVQTEEPEQTNPPAV